MNTFCVSEDPCTRDRGEMIMNCTLCPRKCNIDRDTRAGYCKSDRVFHVARIAPHMWEEPVLSGKRGAGTVFFSGCNLGCVYCQNKVISRNGLAGRAVSADTLLEMMLELAESGVHCIELVTPTHYADLLVPVLEKLRTKCTLPTVWNSGGYESVDTLRHLDGLVDVYLPDFKYASRDLAKKYSNAEDYPERAAEAIAEMYRQTGAVRFDTDSMIRRGVIVRHLVLPTCSRDSAEVLERLAKTVPVRDVRVSLMSQYTPEFAADCDFPELHRRVTSFEYNRVVKKAVELGFEGYFQERSSATDKYTPDFEV